MMKYQCCKSLECCAYEANASAVDVWDANTLSSKALVANAYAV